MSSKSKMWTPANILLIGGLLALLATYIATRITDNENKIEKDELRKRLDSAQTEIIRLTQELRNDVTGGKGYCYVNLLPEESGSAGIYLTSDSKYPLYDIKVVVKPWATADQLTPKLTKKDKKPVNPYPPQIFAVDVLPAYDSDQQNNIEHLGSVVFDGKRNWVYTIDFSARNGNWKQTWEMGLDKDSKPITSFIIYKIKIEEAGYRQVILKESIDARASNSVLKSFETKLIPFDSFD